MPRNSAYSLGCQGGQHRPLLGQRALDVLDARQALQGVVDVVGIEVGTDAAQLMQHEFEPQLRGLVLHDEKQLVVMRWIAPQVLRGQQLSRSR